MDVLDMAVAWDATTPSPQNPSEVTNVFDSRKITQAQVKRHANLVWAKTTHRGAANKTPSYFKIFRVLQTNVVAPRNQRKLRQVTFGKMLWNSIAP
eukprot:9270864-Ditylum_brightwellii.AAC.1